MSQDYYPEIMAKLAIVNAPSSFTFIWSIIKPWLSKETAEKVDVLGSDYQSVLLELVDVENLPTTLGGKCTCEHAGGCDLSGAGPWMDERLAQRKQKTNDTFTVDARAEPPLSSPPGSLRLGGEGDNFLLQQQIVRRLLLQRLVLRPPTPPPHYLHFHLPDIDHDADLDPVPPYDEVEARDPPSPRRAPTPLPEEVAAVNELLEQPVVLAVADDIAEFDLL
ncbi:CRAL-TRIO domain-containing protein [Pisolithus orientalis]|uniref:CRAL-TRIO domain-containing protein n=1 Tax=Pisolithus orientalis TaxID=936130 RepID=UPI0022254CAD|nr:CRAL-TRIO domain-containing protein [Pisolithus orientalis]KAI6030561.1 CRAL-TRIO domain-containing protein [Pisolithus orientalis]